MPRDLEKVKAQKKAWHVANSEKVKARMKAWRVENSEKVMAYQKAYRRDLIRMQFIQAAMAIKQKLKH